MARSKVSVTVDEGLLKAVDKYVRGCEGMDRSKVFDYALRLWLAEQQGIAMEEQYAPGGDPPPEEYEAWRRIRNAAAVRLFWPDKTPE